MSLSVSAQQIFAQFQPSGLISECVGDTNAVISQITAVEEAGPGALVFVDKKDYLETLSARRPTAVVAPASLKNALVELKVPAILIAPSVALAHAHIKSQFADRDFQRSGWDSGIHASAVVHETARIGADTTIEPNAVIGKNVVVGHSCRIMAGVVIENDVVIGNETTIHPNVVIGYGCRVGNQVLIGSSTVIGSEGYGFAQDKSRKSYRIPQTGIVVIEDRVRIGAGNCIDRATYKETRIGAGTKTDNLCHIAHNVTVGEDCLLTAMLCVAGSTKIGNRVITSGQTGIIDHVNVCDDVVLVHRAGVSKDVEKPGVYAGTPLLPLGEYMKNAAVLKSASDLRKRLIAIERHLGLTSDSSVSP